MKIWYQSTLDFAHHPNYKKALAARFTRVGSPGTEVTLCGRDSDLGRDLLAPDTIGSPIVYHTIIAPIFIRSVLTAEKNGADAFVVGSFSEPIITELRSLARIPVVSITEATLLAACLIAPRIGLVTLSKLVVPFLEKSISLYKLADRVSGIHLVAGGIAEHELDKQFPNPAPYLALVAEAGRAAIAAGAQVIIPAEGVLGVMAAENGMNEIDGVPVIDPIGTPILFAEFAVALKQRTGVTQSPIAYPQPSPVARKLLFAD